MLFLPIGVKKGDKKYIGTGLSGEGGGVGGITLSRNLIYWSVLIITDQIFI